MISYVAAGGGVWAIMGIAGSFASPPLFGRLVASSPHASALLGMGYGLVIW